MKGSAKTLIFAVGSLTLATAAGAFAQDNPYQAIVDRNVFNLGSPPPPPEAPAVPQIPVNITFTGITTLGGERRAWFLVPGPDGKQLPVNLSVGQREGIIELVEIFEDAGEVSVKNSGNEVRLNFKDHGNKTVAAPATTPVPMGMKPPVPGQPAPAVPRMGLVPSPTRTPAPAVYGTQPGAQPAVQGGLRSIPTRTLRLPNIQTPAAQPQPNAGYRPTYEESVINMAFQTELNRDNIISGKMPPLPPTELTPDAPAGRPPMLPGMNAPQ